MAFSPANTLAARTRLTEDNCGAATHIARGTTDGEFLTHRVDQVYRCVSIEHETADLPVAALDATVLDELCDTLGGQTDMVAGLYARFLVHAARYIDALRDQANQAHITTLHTLKGSAAMMGAIRISALASRLHETCLRCPERPAASAIQQLEDELTMFLHALAAHFPE